MKDFFRNMNRQQAIVLSIFAVIILFFFVIIIQSFTDKTTNVSEKPIPIVYPTSTTVIVPTQIQSNLVVPNNFKIVEPTASTGNEYVDIRQTDITSPDGYLKAQIRTSKKLKDNPISTGGSSTFSPQSDETVHLDKITTYNEQDIYRVNADYMYDQQQKKIQEFRDNGFPTSSIASVSVIYYKKNTKGSYDSDIAGKTGYTTFIVATIDVTIDKDNFKRLVDTMDTIVKNSKF